MPNANTVSGQNYVVHSGSCQGCRHFSITHNAKRPYACRAFGVMSRQHPARDILNTSGEACRMRSVSVSSPFALEGGRS